MQIVLDTRGLQLSVRNKCFLIAFEKKASIIHPGRISSILVTAPCRVSSPALILAAENEIPFIVCNGYGQPVVRIWSPGFINTSQLRKAQYGFCSSMHGLKWAKSVIQLKIAGQIDNLQNMAEKYPEIKTKVLKATGEINVQTHRTTATCVSTDDMHACIKTIRFVEAYAAARYWSLVGNKLPPPFAFSGRSKRKQVDLANACINYLYGMLRHETETALLSIGLDPAIGILHRDGYKMPSLVFDLMEPFRPIMDGVLFDAMLKGQLPVNSFVVEMGNTMLGKDMRKALIRLYSHMNHAPVLFRNRSTPLRNHLLTEARQLALLCTQS